MNYEMMCMITEVSNVLAGSFDQMRPGWDDDDQVATIAFYRGTLVLERRPMAIVQLGSQQALALLVNPEEVSWAQWYACEAIANRYDMLLMDVEEYGFLQELKKEKKEEMEAAVLQQHVDN